MNDQNNKEPHDEPAFLSKTVYSKLQSLQQVYEKINRKKAPKAPKVDDIKAESVTVDDDGSININGVKLDGVSGSKMDAETL